MNNETMNNETIDIIGDRSDSCSFGRSNPLPNIVLNFERNRARDPLVSKRNNGEDQENAKMRIRKSCQV
jgi:hypothetical protein